MKKAVSLACMLLTIAAPCGRASAAVFPTEDHVLYSGGPNIELDKSSHHPSDVAPSGEVAISYSDSYSGYALNGKKYIYEADGSVGVGQSILGSGYITTWYDVCFDSDGVLNTFEGTGGEQIMIHKRRTEAGFETLLFEPIPFKPGPGVSHQLVDFFKGVDGRVHLVEHIRMYNSDPDRTILWGTFADEQWSFTTVHGWHGERLFAAKVDGRGDLHLLGTEKALNPLSTNLVYYRWDGEALYPEVVNSPPVNQYTHQDVFGDMDLAGTPRCVATREHRDADSFLVAQEVSFYERDDEGRWQKTSVAAAGDGYSGTSGNNHAGAECQLRMDDNGGAHVVYLDTAADSEVVGPETVRQIVHHGNLHYMYRSADSPHWINCRILEQHYPANDGTSNVFTFNIAGWTVSRDGSSIDLIGAETVRLPDTDAMGDFVSMDVHHLRVYNSRSINSSPGALMISRAMLGTVDAADAASLDQDDNDLIDGADLVAVAKF